jgi:hypothetical protein
MPEIGTGRSNIHVMPSAALGVWNTTRAGSLDRLRAAHKAVGGSGPGRRWVTAELNQALILRLAGEFQGFARDLHDEATAFVTRTLAPGSPSLQATLSIPYTAHRQLNERNAQQGSLGTDFGLFGIQLWQALGTRYPAKKPVWNEKLRLLNDARNGIAHQDLAKIAKVVAQGWPLTLPSFDRWRSALDSLAEGIDRVVGVELTLIHRTSPW